MFRPPKLRSPKYQAIPRNGRRRDVETTVEEEITNRRTGQVMRFLEGSQDPAAPLLRMETVNPPTGVSEPTHVHPRQESRARVISGELCFEVAGELERVGPGDELVIPANVPHRFWNEGPGDAEAVQEFRPALNIADFFRTYFELANSGEVADDGKPSMLRMAAEGPRFGDAIRVTSPPWWAQRVAFAVLGPIAKLRGY
jgi:quercetin dioxygenase-like cupin family protein